ncbi:MAG: 2-dehydropantoate 2-reductase [Sandaracinaceae bacterium]
MKIGVMGAGSIGCYVGGRVLAARGADVVFLGRARLQSKLREHGIRLSSLDAFAATVAPDRVVYETDVSVLGDCDVVFVCVKSAQSEEVGRALNEVLSKDCAVVSLQNGVRNADVLGEALGRARVQAGIVSFNVVSKGDGRFHQGTSGPLMIERGPEFVTRALEATGLDVEVRDDLAPDQWAKLLVNLNNAVSALSGAQTRSLILEPVYRRIIALVVEEGLAVLRAAQVRPASLRGVPMGILPTLFRLPTPIVRLVMRKPMRADPEARSSMWEDLERRRPTEVHFLNGEIVRLAASCGVPAPVNTKIVQLIREAEAAGAGSPNIEGEALLRAVLRV